MFTLFKLPEASTFAANVDKLYDVIHWVSVVGFLGVVIAMLYFMVRYHQSKVDPQKTPFIEGHTPSEIGVSVALLILVMVFFAWGWIDYKHMVTAPENAYEINVTGKKWSWEFQYANGRRMQGHLVVPANTPVKLIMTSQDVLHSFYIPDFRVKRDVVPNYYSTLWFEAVGPGTHHVFCAEFCGTDHSRMRAEVEVKSAQDFALWQEKWEFEQRTGIKLAQAGEADSSSVPLTPIQLGEKLYKDKVCFTCHSTTGEKVVGPTFKGVFGREEELHDGTKITVDENYIRESIVDPQAKIVKGFGPPSAMPPYMGTLSDEEINALVAYIKSIK